MNTDQILAITAGQNSIEIEMADGRAHWMRETPEQVVALAKTGLPANTSSVPWGRPRLASGICSCCHNLKRSQAPDLARRGLKRFYSKDLLRGT